MSDKNSKTFTNLFGYAICVQNSGFTHLVIEGMYLCTCWLLVYISKGSYLFTIVKDICDYKLSLYSKYNSFLPPKDSCNSNKKVEKNHLKKHYCTFYEL